MSHYFQVGELFFYPQKNEVHRKEEILKVRPKTAELFTVLLEAKGNIVSKSDLLKLIWTDVVVEEHVVFQSIAELRKIFDGASIIKTHPRKGYSVTAFIKEFVEETPKPHHVIAAKVINKESNKPSLTVSIIVGVMIITALVTLFLINNNKSPIQLTVITPKNATANASIKVIKQAMSPLNDVSLSYLPSNIYPSQAFASPNFVFKRSKIAPDEWLFWSERFSSEQGVFLRYGLSRQQIHWQGFIYAESVEQLPFVLTKRIKELIALGLFSTSLEKLNISTLKSMLAIAPEDTDLLLLVAEHFKVIGQYDVALSYLEKLGKLHSTMLQKVYMVQAYWKEANIYKMRGQPAQAHNSLDDMKAALSSVPLGAMYFQYIETKAWLAYDERKYQEMNQILEEALTVFYPIKLHNHSQEIDPLVLFKFHILYSILAKKLSDENGKYHHLNQAQALLIKHNLDESNLAVVFYHSALFAQQERDNKQRLGQQSSNDAFLVYLNKILGLPRTSDNYWVHDYAFELLVNHYIKMQQFEAAMALFPAHSLSPKQLYLKAELLIAQNQNKQALDLYKAAFDEARITYDTRTGVDAALYLYHHFPESSKARYEYKAYLDSNANKDWLIENLSL